MHGFQNDLALLFICNICSGKLKFKVTLEGQMIKWSNIELVLSTISTFILGFQNDMAYVFI